MPEMREGRTAEVKCWHDDPAYVCKLCGRCCACTHKYEERDGVWLVKCKNGPWRRVVGPLARSQGF